MIIDVQTGIIHYMDKDREVNPLPKMQDGKRPHGLLIYPDERIKRWVRWYTTPDKGISYHQWYLSGVMDRHRSIYHLPLLFIWDQGGCYDYVEYPTPSFRQSKFSPTEVMELCPPDS